MMVRSERLAQEAMAAGYETFEESDDFDIPDDPLDPATPYENEFEPSLQETQAALKARRRPVKGVEREGASLDGTATPDDPDGPDAKSGLPKPKKRLAKGEESGDT